MIPFTVFADDCENEISPHWPTCYWLFHTLDQDAGRVPKDPNSYEASRVCCHLLANMFCYSGGCGSTAPRGGNYDVASHLIIERLMSNGKINKGYGLSCDLQTSDQLEEGFWSVHKGHRVGCDGVSDQRRTHSQCIACRWKEW